MKMYLLVSSAIFIYASSAATTFEFINKRSDKRSIELNVEQAGVSKSDRASSDVPGSVSFDGDNKNIDILTLESVVKDEEKMVRGDLYTTSYIERDVIYIAKELTPQERAKYEQKEDKEISPYGKFRITTKVYSDPKLKGKTKFKIAQGKKKTGFFQVDSIN